MNRREAIGAAVVGVVAVASGVSAASSPAQQADSNATLRAVWRWHEPTKEWIRCRMDTLKPGDTFSIELDERTGKRFVGTVSSHPRYLPDGGCEICGNGEEITVPYGPH